MVPAIQVLPHFQIASRPVNVTGVADPDNEPIRILQLTDMHLFPDGATSWKCTPKGLVQGRLVDFAAERFPTPHCNSLAARLVSDLVEDAQPHMVVFTGDIVDARPWGASNPALKNGKPAADVSIDDSFLQFKEAFMSVVQPLAEAGIPWCFCPGNHDDDRGPWVREDLLRIFSLPGCATPSAKRFDHTLTVGFGSEADESSIRLWLFDSGPNAGPEKKYEPVSPAAVAEYERLTSCVLPRTAAELAYVHIPLPEYAEATIVAGTDALYEARLRIGAVPLPWAWVPPSLVRALGLHRTVGCSRVNTGLFDAIARGGRVAALSCGHNHFNDFVAHKQGVYLCFGRISGISPPTTWEHDGGPLPFSPGGRVMEVLPGEGYSSRVQTWIQVPGGRQDDYIQLSDTRTG